MIVESFKIKGWKEKERGLLISENEDWILVKHIPVDYVVDGYKLYRKQFVKNRKSGKKDAAVAKVLGLKKVELKPPAGFTFMALAEQLAWVEKTYQLFEIQDAEEDEVFYGKNASIQEGMLSFDFIKSNGQLDLSFDYEFSLENLRVLTFETDYFESIRLLTAAVAKDETE